MPIKDKHILLVEDDITVRATVTAMLHQIGVGTVYAVSNGEEAMEFFQSSQDKIDLIICDWNMPKRTGFEFLLEVHATAPEMPFLMVTARADMESILAAKDNGVSGYLRKPFESKELRAKMTAIFDAAAKEAAAKAAASA